MTQTQDDTLSVVVERTIAHPPEKIWRALTEPHLIEEWLMKGDFRPAIGHRFGFRADWGAVDCEVLDIEPPHLLAYSWGDHELKSIVTWTLTPKGSGTQLRMERNRPASAATSRAISAGRMPVGRASSTSWKRSSRG